VGGGSEKKESESFLFPQKTSLCPEMLFTKDKQGLCVSALTASCSSAASSLSAEQSGDDEKERTRSGKRKKNTLLKRELQNRFLLSLPLLFGFDTSSPLLFWMPAASL
jgi:hypothetical protein